MKHEYYFFGGDLTERENFFLTKVLQRHRFRPLNDWIGAYVSVIEQRQILGRDYYTKSIQKLITLGYIEKEQLGVNDFGNDIYAFVPLKTKYKRMKTNNKAITCYYQTKHSNLSKTARKVYKHLSHGVFDITYEEFMDKGIEYYPTYRTKKDNPLDLPQYREYLLNVWDMIEGYNTANKTQRVEYVSEDTFGNRLHSIFTSTPKYLRSYIRLWGHEVSEIDLKQSQPTILAKILYDRMGDNSFTRFIQSGEDLYHHLCPTNRDSGKKMVFQILFSKGITKQFKTKFPDIIPTLQSMKWGKIKDNSSNKHNSNLACLLQREESRIFRIIWEDLVSNCIPFIPIHDSFLIPSHLLNKSMIIINNNAKRLIPYAEWNINAKV